MGTSLQNQGMLVVDGTEGIAPQVIALAASQGANVVFTARRHCERAAERIAAQAQTAGCGDRVCFLVSDLADEAAVDGVLDAAIERLPRFNTLIHNLEPHAVRQAIPLVDMSLAEWNHVLATELRVPFMVARRSVEEFLCSQIPGRIVYVAYSGPESRGAPASYAAAQTGLVALVRCITKEFGRREVACNAVVIRGSAAAAARHVPETILFLSSPESAFVNGEHVDVQ